MKRALKFLGWLAFASLFFTTGSSLGLSTPASEDAYTPLKLYDGKWEIRSGGEQKELTKLENHCTRTGIFFVCEQSVSGGAGGSLQGTNHPRESQRPGLMLAGVTVPDA